MVESNNKPILRSDFRENISTTKFQIENIYGSQRDVKELKKSVTLSQIFTLK